MWVGTHETTMEKFQLNSLREVIAQKSAQQAAVIETLKAEGKSEKSMQCMKVYTDFDLLVIDVILGVEGAAEKMVKKLDARYNKVAWVEIDKQEYIKLLGGDYPEDKLKMEKGKFYKK